MTAHSVAEQLRLVHRAMTTLSRSTEALLRATDEPSLLDEVCSIAVDVAGYRLAWIGYARRDEDFTVEPVAMAGAGRGYVETIRVSWGDSALGRGPTGTAIRTGVPQVLRDTEGDPRFLPWREAARRFGFRSAIALPIGHGDQCIGALNIYAGEPNAFESDTIRLLEDQARNLSYGIGALRMKAEHHRALRELAESEARYRSLIGLIPDAVIIYSQGIILYANHAAVKTFAAGSAAGLERRPLLHLVHESCRDEVLARMAAPPPGRLLVEYRLTRLDGRSFVAEVAGTTITFNGQPARLLVIRDVTDRQLVQEQLVQAAKLATLGEMAAGLVHELSQPLNIIRLSAEGALMFIERGKATQEWQAQQFQLVAEQAQRTAEIIDDIRIFSRRDTSPVQVFDSVQALRAAAGVLEGQFRADGIGLVVELPAEPVPVRGRRVQLEQVMMNLLSNAHHAVRQRREQMPADWQGRVTVRGETDGRCWRILVADNGPGIPPDLRTRIFEPFFTTKEAGRGTGLGLSVSFGIVNAMRGRLEVADSAEGACFAIVLPVDGEMAAAAEIRAPAPAIVHGDAHVMVVDDERPAAEALGRSLSEMGYRVSVAENGERAWALFSEDPADVVITDLRMPAGGGEKLVEKLRDYDPLLPIIIVTGHLGNTERLTADLEDDRCAVLRKPIALAALGELVARFLEPPADLGE